MEIVHLTTPGSTDIVSTAYAGVNIVPKALVRTLPGSGKKIKTINQCKEIVRIFSGDRTSQILK